MTQLAFDLDMPTDTAFPAPQTAENGGKCSRCHRALKGRYARFHGAGRPEGFYAWCDDCSVAMRGAS